MSVNLFVRQLGAQPGVQLNQILQAANAAFGGDTDQLVALPARLTRGRIDQAFLVNATNVERMTGVAEPMRVNALNEANLQMHEALKNGAASVLVSRLVPVAAEKRYVGVTIGGGVSVTYLFRDDFTGTGGIYGRQADTVNHFPDLVWTEDQDKGFVLDGFMRTQDESWTGFETYIVGVPVSDYGTVAEYNPGQFFDVAVEAHEVHLRVTRKTTDGHSLIVDIFTSGSSYGGSVAVSELIDDPVDVIFQIPENSGVTRYQLTFGVGTGIDFFAIVKPD